MAKSPRVPKVPKLSTEDTANTLVAVKRIEKKLDELERKLFKYAADMNSDLENVLTVLGKIGTKVFGTDDECEDEEPVYRPKKKKDAPKHVIVLYPNVKKSRKDLPVLYYEGVRMRPEGPSKILWTKNVNDAATGLKGTMEDIVSDICDTVDGYPSHYYPPEAESFLVTQMDDASVVEDDE